MNNLGQVKVTDFGISKELGDKSMCSTFVGTFRYMSPERMEGREYSYPSDIWSLGIVVYECVSGVFPYESSDTEIDVLYYHYYFSLFLLFFLFLFFFFFLFLFFLSLFSFFSYLFICIVNKIYY